MNVSRRVSGLVFMLFTLSFVAHAQCPHKVTNKALPEPKLDPAESTSASITGSGGQKDTIVQVCQDGKVVGRNDVYDDGSFSVDLGKNDVFAPEPFTVDVDANATLANGKRLVAQFISTDGTLGYGPESGVTIGGDLSKAILIGGVEQSGYSSLGQNTNAFLNVFIEGPEHWVSGWGKVRLLSTPQPSTQGIVSTFTDPTGQLMNQDYSKVGQALDFVVGPKIVIPGTNKHWAFIAGFGLTTPLNSQNVTLTYVVPPAGTQECKTLTSRFTVQNGYAPGVTPAAAGSSTCLAAPVTNIAFSNQDRSSFLLKYGAGFRTSNKFECSATGGSGCSPSYGVLDMTFGQDESVTRGLLRHVVFKLDGILPIPTGKASYLYLFGSAYIRLAKNQNLSPLILQTASGVTIPSSSVVVLPLQIPDRDFYRLGIGLNVNQIFCKMFNQTCSTKSDQQPQIPIKAN